MKASLVILFAALLVVLAPMSYIDRSLEKTREDQAVITSKKQVGDQMYLTVKVGVMSIDGQVDAETYNKAEVGKSCRVVRRMGVLHEGDRFAEFYPE